MKTSKEIKRIRSYYNNLRDNEYCFSTLFKIIFSEKDKIMFTFFENNLEKSFTYGQIEKYIYYSSKVILRSIQNLKFNSWIAINSENKMIWTIAFWSCLLSGFRVYLLNPKQLEDTNQQILDQLNIKYVVGDTPYGNTNFIELSNFKEISDKQELNNFGNEIALCSSGSSSISKVAIYSDKKIVENIFNFEYVYSVDHDFIKHYNHQFVHLVTLPFYHIFGLILVFFWYSFSHSQFVLSNELSSNSFKTISKKIKVSTIFSIPAFFEKVSNKFWNSVKTNGNAEKINSLIKFNNFIQDVFPHFGLWLVRNIFARKLRKETFGQSIRFFGIGGARISNTTIRFLCGLGYRPIIGYGTTELSIITASFGCSHKALMTGTVGNKLYRGKYVFTNNNELMLQVPTASDYIIQNNKIQKLDSNLYISTGDIGHVNNNYIYIDSRKDNLIILPNGEKIYPDEIEQYFQFLGHNIYCIVCYRGKLVLIIQESNFGKKELFENYFKIKTINKTIPFSLRIQEVRKTQILFPVSIKGEILRTKLIELLNLNPDLFPLVNHCDLEMEISATDEKINLVKKEIAEILLIKDIDSISPNDDFFIDLGGDSLSYMELCSRLNLYGRFDGKYVRSVLMTTVIEIAAQLKNCPIVNKERRE